MKFGDSYMEMKYSTQKRIGLLIRPVVLITLLVMMQQSFSQNVGITNAASITPNYLLHVHNSSVGGSMFQLTNATTLNAATDGFVIDIDNLLKVMFKNQEATGNMAFFTGGAERVTILSGGNVGINNTNPDVSALLDIKATNKGVLIPRVNLTSTSDAATIPTPATTLLVFNNSTNGTPPTNVIPGYYYNAGTSIAPLWTPLGAKGSKFTVHYDNRFRVSNTTYTNYFFNSQNYGPGSEGSNTYPYRNDYLDFWYLANPASIPVPMGIWQSTVGITSPCFMTKFTGWAMVENQSTGASGVAVTRPSTITVYFYKYTPTNAGTGNLVGTLVASGTTPQLTNTYYSYSISFTPSSAILLNPGDFLIGYVKSSDYPSVGGVYSIQTLIGEIEFSGQ